MPVAHCRCLSGLSLSGRHGAHIQTYLALQTAPARCTTTQAVHTPSPKSRTPTNRHLQYQTLVSATGASTTLSGRQPLSCKHLLSFSTRPPASHATVLRTPSWSQMHQSPSPTQSPSLLMWLQSLWRAHQSTRRSSFAVQRLGPAFCCPASFLSAEMSRLQSATSQSASVQTCARHT